MRAKVLTLVAAALLLTGCTASADEITPTPSSTVGAPGCRPPSPIRNYRGGPEVSGTGARGSTLSALVMTGRAFPLKASKEPVKFVVRMTGSGELAVTVRAPDETDRPLTFGPELHGDSSYDRPGREWGLGTVFDEPGCWTLHFTRTRTGAADVYVSVRA